MRDNYIKYIMHFLDMLDDEHVKKVYSFTKTLATMRKREVTD